uniref:SSD domain-containing protein n=1 Tax=Heterorhabditis bacteriophora TaxID=37862 RepID=A0A1I7X4J2_HETBA
MLLNHGFGRVGAIVGTYPVRIFLSCVVIFLASLSFILIFSPIFRLSFDEGYTTKDAPSIRELKAQIGFFGNKGTPWYMALFAVPRDLEKGSMIESGEFDEFKQFYKSVKKDIVIREEGNKSITYMDYCGSMCDFNEVIFKTYSMAIFGLQWPETSIFTYKSNIGKYFFEREMNGDEIIRSKMSALYFMVFVNSTSTANDLREFERKVNLKLEEHNANDSKLTTLIQHSARGMEMEITRGTRMVIYKMALGLGLTAVLTFISLVLLNMVHGRSTGRVLCLWMVAFLVPLMSLITATAFCCLINRHFNTIMFVSPVAAFAVGSSQIKIIYRLFNNDNFCYSFLVTLFLGLDGIFILYNTWLNESNQRRDNVGEHMLEVFASCLPSITIINAAAIGLMASGLFPIEEFANLSFFLGVTIISLNMTMFKNFITHDIYKAWNSGVQFRFEEDGTSIITRMLFMVGFEGTSSMADKAVLMTNCRKVAAKYPMFNTIPFDTEVGMVDVILQIPQITYVIPTFIYVIVFVLFVAFVGNLAVSVVVLLSAVSVYAGSYCMSALFGMTLNPFSVAFLIFAATVSPKFCTHICYFFQQMGLFGDSSSPFDECMEKVTAEHLTSENWGMILDICDKINSDPKAPKAALLSIKKRLNHRDPHVVILALSVLDSCWSNCGPAFRKEVSSANFISELESKATHSTRLIAEKTRVMIKKWVDMECKTDASLSLMCTLHKNLLADGYSFEFSEPKKKTVISNDPNVVSSQEEEDAIAKAIALSLQDAEKKPKTNIYPNGNGYSGANIVNNSGLNSSRNVERTVRALYDFEAAEDNELSFVTGDLITVTDDSNSNWWRGRIGVQQGLFPSSFVTSDLSEVKPEISTNTTEQVRPVTQIDESVMLKCIQLLEDCDPTGEIPDPSELTEVEAASIAQGPLIDARLASIDRQSNTLAQVDMAIRDVLALYDQAVQQAHYQAQAQHNAMISGAHQASVTALAAPQQYSGYQANVTSQQIPPHQQTQSALIGNPQHVVYPQYPPVSTQYSSVSTPKNEAASGYSQYPVHPLPKLETISDVNYTPYHPYQQQQQQTAPFNQQMHQFNWGQQQVQNQAQQF